MYQLYYTRDSSAMGCHAALEEIGAEFELHHVDMTRKRCRDYLALNPLGKVPTLVDERGDGERLVMYQSGAILLYLADRHPEAALAPAPGSMERGLCYQWLSFLGEMLQASYMMAYYSERFTAEAEGREAVAAKGCKWVMEYLSLVESALIPRPYLLGETFSVCDLYLHTLSRWNPPGYPRFADFPSLSRNAALVEARPAVRRMLEVQGEAA